MEKLFVSIAEAAKATGLSTFALRKGVRNNSIPHIMCGTKYLIHYPRLLEQLEHEANAGVKHEEMSKNVCSKIDL